MAIAVYFKTTATRAQYDDIWKRLDAADLHDPKGRTYHVSWGEDGALEVFDVWDSPADFDAFGEKLMPILADVGVEATPMIQEAYRVVTP